MNLQTQLLDLVRAACQETPWACRTINEDMVVKAIETAAVSDGTRTKLFLRFEEDEVVGMVVGYKTPLPFFQDFVIAGEVFWYVKPCKQRRKHWFDLLDEFMEWAKQGQVAHQIQIGNYNPRIVPIYEKLGFKTLSSTLYMDINNV